MHDSISSRCFFLIDFMFLPLAILPALRSMRGRGTPRAESRRWQNGLVVRYFCACSFLHLLSCSEAPGSSSHIMSLGSSHIMSLG